MLEQKKTVLTIHPEQHTDTHTYFQYGDDGSDFRVGYYLSMAEWVAMDCPEQIAVTATVDTSSVMTGDLRDEGLWSGTDADLNHHLNGGAQLEWDIDNNCPLTQSRRIELEERSA